MGALKENKGGASASLRKALGAKVGKQLRRVPELNFYVDDSLDFVDEVQRALHT